MREIDESCEASESSRSWITMAMSVMVREMDVPISMSKTRGKPNASVSANLWHDLGQFFACLSEDTTTGLILTANLPPKRAFSTTLMKCLRGRTFRPERSGRRCLQR